MIEAWLVILSVISFVSVACLVLVLREFLPAYLREKGKNLATHEDIDRIVEQLRKTTEATEDIKAQVHIPFDQARPDVVGRARWVPPIKLP